MILTRDAILGAQDLKTQDVEVPEWGGAVRVRSMTGAERDAFASSLIGKDGKADTTGYGVKLVALCTIGEDGKALFTVDDLQALNAKSAQALERVFQVADALNTISAETVDAAEKN